MFFFRQRNHAASKAMYQCITFGEVFLNNLPLSVCIDYGINKKKPVYFYAYGMVTPSLPKTFRRSLF